MPTVKFENVTLAFTNNMEKPSDFGGHNYSFIINSAKFCDAVKAALATQKTQVWDVKKNTNDFIIKKCNAKSKDDVTYEPVNDMMQDDDLLVQVKSKSGAIENTKGATLARGTTADVLVDVFEYEYGKKQFICVRCHPERGCTVKVNDLKEYTGGLKYFDKESDADKGFNAEALNAITSDDIAF